MNTLAALLQGELPDEGLSMTLVILLVLLDMILQAVVAGVIIYLGLQDFN